jgi:hypothetical protein
MGRKQLDYVAALTNLQAKQWQGLIGLMSGFQVIS